MLHANFKGKRALVTGASRGIGRHLAEVLARAGADVVLLARTAAPLHEAAAEIRQLGLEATAVPADLTCPSTVHAIVDDNGPFDILVNNAGTAAHAPMIDVALKEWRAVMATNVDAVLLLSQACARSMIKRG